MYRPFPEGLSPQRQGIFFFGGEVVMKLGFEDPTVNYPELKIK
jgi:hypothetical protein